MEISYICAGCLGNPSLIRFVHQNRKTRLKECPICKSRNQYAVDIETISEHIAACINHNFSNLESRDGTDYDPDRNCFYYIDTDNPVEVTHICEILEEHCVLDWSIDYDTRIEIYKAFFDNIYPKQGIYDDLAETGWSHAVSDDLFFSWKSFQYLIQNNNRFFDYQQQSRTAYLDKIFSVFHDFEDEISEDTIFYRVRNDSNLQPGILDSEKSALKEISPAPCIFTKSYRMSPRGISYTYLSADIKTCMKECNTKTGDRILIGIFKTSKALRILDLQIKENPYVDLFSGRYDREKQNIGHFLKQYSSEISKPVDSNSEFDYLPTQVIAEYIRFKGYDGIAYCSAKTGKTNYVFFYGPDYDAFPEIRPQGWTPYIASVPSFTQAFTLKGCAFCEVKNSFSCDVSIEKTIGDFDIGVSDGRFAS